MNKSSPNLLAGFSFNSIIGYFWAVTLVEIYFVQGEKMRLNKKLLGVLLSVLLTAMLITIPVTPVSAAATVSVGVTPASGPSGTIVYVTAGPCTAGASFTVLMGSNNVASGTVPLGGTVTTYFSVPVLVRNAYSISVSTSAGETTLTPATFSLTPIIHLNNASGAAGDQVTLSGNGFYSNTAITIYFDSNPVTLASPVTTDYNGQFNNATFTVPTAAGGAHTVTAGDTGGVSFGANFTVSAKLSLSAATGNVGSSITASGSGFAVSSPMSFFIDGTAFSSTARTDATGNFSNVAIIVPAVSGGAHTITATDNIGNSLSAPFTITGTTTVSPTSGAVDSTVTVTGQGFQATSPIQISFDGAAVTTVPASVTSDETGKFSASLKIPAGSSGTHVIKITDGANTTSTNFNSISTASVTPASGPVGTTVTAKGSGFKGNGTVTINYNNAQIATATANGLGNFSTTFTIPAASTGSHPLVLSDSSNTQPFTFSITATPKDPSPTTGPIGTNVSTSGSGFGASKTLNITYDGNPVTLTPVSTTDANGTFNVSFKIPVSKSGNHTIVVSDGTTSNTYTFKLDATPPAAPALTLPAAATKLGKVPTLSWSPVTDANGGITYNMQISKDQSFNTVLITKSGLTTPTYTLDTNVPAEKLKSASKSAPYYWRVQATDAAGNVSAWTTPQTFLVGLALSDYIVYIIFAVIAIMLGVLGFVLGRITKRSI